MKTRNVRYSWYSNLLRPAPGQVELSKGIQSEALQLMFTFDAIQIRCKTDYNRSKRNATNQPNVSVNLR